LLTTTDGLTDRPTNWLVDRLTTDYRLPATGRPRTGHSGWKSPRVSTTGRHSWRHLPCSSLLGTAFA